MRIVITGGAGFVGSHLEHVVSMGEPRLRCWAPADATEIPDGERVLVSVRTDRLQALRLS